MRRADSVCGVLLAVIGVVVIVEGLRLGIGWGSDGPEPGFFIFYLGVALLGSSLLIAAAASRQHSEGGRFAEGGQLRSVAAVFVPAVLMVILTHVAGLYVSGALYLAAYMRWVGRHRWVTVVLVAIAIPLTAFLIFEIWFLVPLPKGPLESRLGY